MATTRLIERDHILSYLRQFDKSEPRMNVLTYGPPGTGKTSLAWGARLKGQQVFELTCTSEQSAAVMTGFFIPKGDHFEYLDGIGVKGWLGEPIRLFADPKDPYSEYEDIHMGGLLVINEIDKASPDMMDVIHVIADDPTVARLYLPDGRVVRPAPGFWCFATTNALPDDLPEPIKDRFPIKLGVWEPGQGQLDLLSEPTRELCKNLYSSVKGSGRSPAFTYRQLRAFDRLVTAGSPVDLAASVVANEPTAAASLTEDYNLAAVKFKRKAAAPAGTSPEDSLKVEDFQITQDDIDKLRTAAVPAVARARR